MNFIRLEYLDVVAKKMLLLILFIALCGCQPPYDGTSEEPNESWTKWTDGQLVSIVDDSLAVLKICKYYKKTWYEWGFSGSQEYYEITDSRTGLFIVNYRNKQKPLFGDTLLYDLKVVNDYYKDSLALVFDEKNSQFGFWKIGTNSIKFKKYNSSENLYVDYPHNDIAFKARPWINENILLVKHRYESSPNLVLILNTETGQIESFEFSGEYEWLSGCNDFSYIENKIVCIRRNDEYQNLELVVNGTVYDTSRWWYNVSNWYGNYIKEGIGDESIGEISKIDTKDFKFDKTITPMWVKNARINNSHYAYEFYSAFQEDSSNFNSSNFIRYYPKDLIKVDY
jgi:hypothetical protein